MHGMWEKRFFFTDHKVLLSTAHTTSAKLQSTLTFPGPRTQPSMHEKHSRKDTKFGTQHLRNPLPSGHHQTISRILSNWFPCHHIFLQIIKYIWSTVYTTPARIRFWGLIFHVTHFCFYKSRSTSDRRSTQPRQGVKWNNNPDKPGVADQWIATTWSCNKMMNWNNPGRPKNIYGIPYPPDIINQTNSNEYS